MSLSTAPHYLLLCEVNVDASDSGADGRWMFILERLGSSERLEVADTEPSLGGERLQLLAVVRGLEALEQPSRVTLVTSSRYVARGIRLYLNRWRENDFQWERFGTMVPIKNQDLWRRISRAMDIHNVDCRGWQLQVASKLASAIDQQDVFEDPVDRHEPTSSDLEPAFPPDTSRERSVSVGQASREQWSKVATAVSSRIRSVGFENSYDCALM